MVFLPLCNLSKLSICERVPWPRWRASSSRSIRGAGCYAKHRPWSALSLIPSNEGCLNFRSSVPRPILAPTEMIIEEGLRRSCEGSELLTKRLVFLVLIWAREKDLLRKIGVFPDGHLLHPCRAFSLQR